MQIAFGVFAQVFLMVVTLSVNSGLAREFAEGSGFIKRYARIPDNRWKLANPADPTIAI